MSHYFPEFFAFATVHILSLISPGPDFMMVLRSSLRDSRRTALLVALGIACGEIIHVSYSILGLGVLIHESVWLMNMLRYVGAAYLIYVGINSLRAKKEQQRSLDEVGQDVAYSRSEMRSFRAWRMGFLTNILNVKAAFFTISCFAVFVSPETPFSVRTLYGLFVVVSSMIWFAIVVFCLTNSRVQSRFIGVKHWIERTCGAVLIVFGVQLALSH